MNTPAFTVSVAAPLLGTAGLDRIAGTGDDLLPQSQVRQRTSTLGPRQEAWGIIANPFTGLGASMLVPAAADGKVVQIEIKSSDTLASLNPNSQGVTEVAVLSSPAFDATQLDPSSPRFGPAGADESHGLVHVEDVNGDGRADAVLHFSTVDARFACSDTLGTVTGRTRSGTPFIGTLPVRLIGCR